ARTAPRPGLVGLVRGVGVPAEPIGANFGQLRQSSTNLYQPRPAPAEPIEPICANLGYPAPSKANQGPPRANQSGRNEPLRRRRPPAPPAAPSGRCGGALGRAGSRGVPRGRDDTYASPGGAGKAL